MRFSEFFQTFIGKIVRAYATMSTVNSECVQAAKILKFLMFADLNLWQPKSGSMYSIYDLVEQFLTRGKFICEKQILLVEETNFTCNPLHHD